MIAEFLENFGMAEWAADAIGDSFAVLPFLFVIFLLVEFFEFYFSDKVNAFMKSAKALVKNTFLFVLIVDMFKQKI